ncbi:flagellar basal body-associated FliL family protein [Thalassotalea sp. PLHSN55]|uniref:flagellar basal body-associated FliL family protein n=1 Tax=Thalassotalea sp. PLHSN55 TaxID=3435888 RepID=UPI003F83ACD1
MKTATNHYPQSHNFRYINGSSKVVFLTFIATLALIASAAIYGKKHIQAFLLTDTPQATEVNQAPKYLSLEKFVISVESDTVIYYMMIEMSLVTSSDKNLTDLNYYLPAIRNAVVKNLSQRDFDSMRVYLKDLTSLQTQLHADVKASLAQYDVAEAIDNVLITKLVIQ